MAHFEQMQFVEETKRIFPESFSGVSVLEVGSMNINGSVRMFFDGCRYIGLDVVPGPGVDAVSPAHLFQAPEGTFDTIISCESMEHDQHWQATLLHIFRMLRPGGLLVFTCASGARAEHGTRRTSPGDSGTSMLDGWGDYYRNLNPEDVREVLDLDALFPGHMLQQVRCGLDMQFRGIKRA